VTFSVSQSCAVLVIAEVHNFVSVVDCPHASAGQYVDRLDLHQFSMHMQ